MEIVIPDARALIFILEFFFRTPHTEVAGIIYTFRVLVGNAQFGPRCTRLSVIRERCFKQDVLNAQPAGFSQN